MMLDKDIVRLQKWWMEQIKALTQKVINEENKRQESVKRKAEKMLGEYRTYNDIQDAYGCGVITARKRDKLMDLLEQVTVEDDTLYRMKLDLLQECYQVAKRAVEERELL